MVKLLLNPKKQGNYAFFCPVSRLHLTAGSPSGTADGVTPAILRAIKSGTLIDVDGVVDLTTGTVKSNNVKEPESSAGNSEDNNSGQAEEQKNKNRQRKNKNKETE